jgi:beta-lactam-binding protein with PASTA domain
MELFRADSLKKVFLHLGIILVLFIGLLVFFFYVYLPNTTHHGETITVPNIVGKNAEELENFLDSKKLRYKINDSTFTPGAKPLTVLTQHPLPDAKVKENRMIYITVAAKNPPEVEMPDLKDFSLKNAQIQLNQHGLLLGEIIHIPGKADMVYDQIMNGRRITPGTKIPKGSRIVLKVGNAAGQEIAVPNFVGMSITDAKSLAAENGVILEIRPNPDATEGTIQRQKPSPDEVSTMKSGETVDVWSE